MIRFAILSLLTLLSSVATAQLPTYSYKGATYVAGSHPPRRGCACAMCQINRNYRAGVYSSTVVSTTTIREAKTMPKESSSGFKVKPGWPASCVPQEMPREIAEKFVPMPWDAVDLMLEVASPKSGSIVVDPGCGDGRILVTAAQQHGCIGIGIEINPETANTAISYIDELGLTDKISVSRGDSRTYSFGNADLVCLYLYSDLINELAPKLKKIKKRGKVISYMHPLPFQGVKRVQRGKHIYFIWENRDGS